MRSRGFVCDDSAPGRRRPRRWLGLLVLAAACAGLALLYYRQSLTAPFNSDGAGNVLQAQALIGGNPLLHGWWSSDVSFYTTELPEYALVTAIRGLSPNVVHLCGALTYTLIVLLTALVARGGQRGGAAFYGAGIAVAITLALTVTGSIGLYLENPNHAGTVVPVLVLLLLVDRAERRADDPAAARWPLPVAACAVLAVAEVGDKLAVAAATVPLGVAGLIRLLRRGEGRAAVRLDRALLAAAAVSAVLAWLVTLTLRALGGFVLVPVNGVAAAPLSQVPGNASRLGQAIVILFGANQPVTSRQSPLISVHGLLAAMAGVHLIGLVLAAAGLAAGIASLWSRHADRAVQLLVVAILIILAFGVFTTLIPSRSYFHEVAVLMPLGAALAGRMVPAAARRLLARQRSVSDGFALPLRSSRPGAAPRRVRPAAVTALSTWLALTVAMAGYAAARPALQPSQQAVAAWLVSHHEHDGLSGYWQATSTTVTSGGQVLVAGITLPVAAAGQAAAYRWESAADWYQPARRDATFVIAAANPLGPGGGLPVPLVRARFGPPAAQEQIGNEVIMQYHYNLLTRLSPTPFPGPGRG